MGVPLAGLLQLCQALVAICKEVAFQVPVPFPLGPRVTVLTGRTLCGRVLDECSQVHKYCCLGYGMGEGSAQGPMPLLASTGTDICVLTDYCIFTTHSMHVLHVFFMAVHQDTDRMPRKEF